LKNSKNSAAAYKYINYRLSAKLQKKVANAKSLNNAPVNTSVKLSAEDARIKPTEALPKEQKQLISHM
jgi:putative spermidine/putrescine transport system substrate-binding protein